MAAPKDSLSGFGRIVSILDRFAVVELRSGHGDCVASTSQHVFLVPSAYYGQQSFYPSMCANFKLGQWLYVVAKPQAGRMTSGRQCNWVALDCGVLKVWPPPRLERRRATVAAVPTPADCHDERVRHVELDDGRRVPYRHVGDHFDAKLFDGIRPGDKVDVLLLTSVEIQSDRPVVYAIKMDKVVVSPIAAQAKVRHSARVPPVPTATPASAHANADALARVRLEQAAADGGEQRSASCTPPTLHPVTQWAVGEEAVPHAGRSRTLAPFARATSQLAEWAHRLTGVTCHQCTVCNRP